MVRGTVVIKNYFRTVRFVHVIGILAAGALLLTGIIAPEIGALDPQLQMLFTIFLATVILWLTKPIPYTISSILCVTLLFTLGVTDTFEAAVSGFASTLVFFFILLLLMGKSIANVDLDDWIASRLVSETSTPVRSMRKLVSTLLLLSLLMPSSTARAATFMPIIDQINELYTLDSDSRFRRIAYYMIGHVNPIGSTALLTGGGMSIVTAEIINATVRPITWVEWAVYMIPPVVFIFAVAMFVVRPIYQLSDNGAPVDTHRSPDLKQSAASTHQPLSDVQRLVLAVFVLTIVFWIVGSFVGISAIIPAMFAVTVFSLPGVRVVTATDVKDLSWGIVFLIGAMLSILNVMENLDGYSLIVDVLFAAIPVEIHQLMLIVLLLGFSIVVRSIFSSVAAAILIMLPVGLEFAAATAIDTLYFSFALLLILVSSTLFPFNISTSLLAHGRGPLSATEVFLLGALTMVVAAVVIAVSWMFYWPAVDALVETLF